MTPMFCFFASRRYWSDEAQLQQTFSQLQTEFPGEDCLLITQPEELDSIQPDRILIAIPMSGAVQSMILAAAERSAYTVLLAGYIQGLFSSDCSHRMLEHNAAPTVMDCWAVLRRSGKALLATSRLELAQCCKAATAAHFVRHAKLLLVGQPEPWVVSVSRDTADYTRSLGVTVEQVAQAELEALYHEMDDGRAAAFVEPIRSGAAEIVEPTPADLLEAGRMGAALEELLRRHRADGAAVACFSLLATGTTACLGVSRVNDSPMQVAACEGDLDSACTMLLMKALTSTRLWMANPSLQADGTASFSHCTAPLSVCSAPCAYRLRSHHESGIGVSPEVELPRVQTLTACRYSAVQGAVTIQRATPVEGPREPTCRTQLRVRWENPAAYLSTSLGCHQVFAFEDISAELRLTAGLLGLQVLEG